MQYAPRKDHVSVGQCAVSVAYPHGESNFEPRVEVKLQKKKKSQRIIKSIRKPPRMILIAIIC